MRTVSMTTQVFAVIGALLLALAVVLGVLGSFAYLQFAALGLLFIAAALIAHAARTSTARIPAFVALVGVVLSLLGTVTTIPFLYVGVGLIVGDGAIVLLLARSRSSLRS